MSDSDLLGKVMVFAASLPWKDRDNPQDVFTMLGMAERSIKKRETEPEPQGESGSMKKVSLDYEAMRENLFSLKQALTFIVEADNSDAGGCYEFSGLAYARVAKEGLTYCNNALERLEKAAETGEQEPSEERRAA